MISDFRISALALGNVEEVRTCGETGISFTDE
jgi:hypothetical protein